MLVAGNQPTGCAGPLGHATQPRKEWGAAANCCLLVRLEKGKDREKAPDPQERQGVGSGLRLEKGKDHEKAPDPQERQGVGSGLPYAQKLQDEKA